MHNPLLSAAIDIRNKMREENRDRPTAHEAILLIRIHKTALRQCPDVSMCLLAKTELTEYMAIAGVT